MSQFWQGKKVLVTGGAGFIGSFVTEQLLAAGATVTITTMPGERKHNIAHLVSKIGIIEADLTDAGQAQTALKDQEVVFHLAAFKKNMAFHKTHPADLLRINTQLTLNIFEAAHLEGVKRLLLMSSAVVYSPDAHMPNTEDEGFVGEPEGAHFGYAWSKRISEVIARGYRDQYGMEIAIARPDNIYGPRDIFDKESAQVVPAFINRVVAHEDPFLIWGDGEQERSFLYVEDLARGLIELTEHYANGEPVNIGTDETIKLKDLAHLLMKLEGTSVDLKFDTTKPNGAPMRKRSNKKSAETIHFKPEYSLEQGLQKTLAWYKNQQKNT